jgi:hypothetical protein
MCQPNIDIGHTYTACQAAVSPLIVLVGMMLVLLMQWLHPH